MRADRLLSILLLLQARGRMTAQELADEVEVSQRTIYRDVEALSMAGVPVYADRGPGGGFALLDRYRTTLTGLNRDEVRALFMLSIPEPLAQLGLDGELKAALLKLSAALPEARRPDEALVRQRFHLDSAWWFQTEEPVPICRRSSRRCGRIAGSIWPCACRSILGSSGWWTRTGWWPRPGCGTWCAPEKTTCACIVSPMCSPPTWPTSAFSGPPIST